MLTGEKNVTAIPTGSLVRVLGSTGTHWNPQMDEYKGQELYVGCIPPDRYGASTMAGWFCLYEDKELTRPVRATDSSGVGVWVWRQDWVEVVIDTNVVNNIPQEINLKGFMCNG